MEILAQSGKTFLYIFCEACKTSLGVYPEDINLGEDNKPQAFCKVCNAELLIRKGDVPKWFLDKEKK